jgi:hypothetical protein
MFGSEMVSVEGGSRGISKAAFTIGLIVAILVSIGISTVVTIQITPKPSLVFSHWDVEWRTITGADQWGAVVGTSTFPATFYFNWGTGNVFQEYKDYVGFYTATMQIKVSRNGPFTFTVGSDDSVVFWIDGSKAIDDSSPHSYRTRSVTVNDLTQGLHTLALDYKEKTGDAALSFNCDLDLVMWYD